MEINLMLGNGDSACNSKVIKFKPNEIYKQVDIDVDISKELPINQEDNCNIKYKDNNFKEHKNINKLQKNYASSSNSENCNDIIFVLVIFLILKMTM